MAKAPQDIPLPDGSTRPQWATEETLLKLLDKFGGGSGTGVGGATGAGGGTAGGGAGAATNPVEQMEQMGETAKTLKKNFGDMGDPMKRHNSQILNMSTALFQASRRAYDFSERAASVNGAISGVATGMTKLGQYLGGGWGLALQVAGAGLEMLANKTKEYLDSMGEMVDAGLAYSGKLGESAAIAANSGLALKSFYGALKETGQAYRALGANGMDAARAFGDLQTQVRDTYGTFGMSADELAKGSADFINLFAATGAKGADAVSGAAKSYGKSLETLRNVSIATGASMNQMKASLGDLLKSPIIINGLRAFGRGTDEAVVAMARGASGFEAVFGKLGKELYQQTAEARAAGLSIINTELGQAIAPFADIQVLDNFRKKLEDNTVSAGEFGASAQAMVNSMGPNIPTLTLLAQQGDANAKKLLEMYNNAKKYTEMSTEELEAIKAKGRAEEKLKSISEKMGAMFEKVSNKLFGMIDLIPQEMMDALSSSFETLTDVLGIVIDIVVYSLKPVMWALGKAIGLLNVVFQPLNKAIVWVLRSLMDMGMWIEDKVLGTLDDFISYVMNFGGMLWEGFKGIMSTVFEMAMWPFTKLADIGALAAKPFTALWDWLKSSWLGKKLLGNDTGSSASNETTYDAMGNPVMSSQVSNSSAGVVAANTKRESFSYGNMADVQKTQTDLMQEMTAYTRQGVQQQRLIADNTERTGKAVEQAGAYA